MLKFRNITSLIFCVLLLLEFILRISDYSYTHLLLKLLVRGYLLVFLVSALVILLKKLPWQAIAGLSVAFLIITIMLLFTFFPLILGFSDKVTNSTYWEGEKYIIEKEKGIGWAGPPYKNYKLFRKAVVGLFKKEISIVNANTNDSCSIDFQTKSRGAVIIYRFSDCSGKGELKIIRN